VWSCSKGVHSDSGAQGTKKRAKDEKDSVNEGVCDTVALPFTLERILRQKKNYGNSNISPSKNIIFKKITKRNQNPSTYYNSITNCKF
jgi:hypothetical protein